MTIIIFIFLSVMPGDPAVLIQGDKADIETVKALREEWGLNKPVLERYVIWCSKVFMLDLGNSLYSNRSVLDLILLRFPYSLYLTFLSLGFSILIGIPLGILAAYRQNSVMDYLTVIGVSIGLSMPIFWLGLLLMLFFGIYFELLPISGVKGSLLSREGFSYVVLPAVTLAVSQIAIICRMTRGSMLEIIRQDYVLTARSKGLSEKVVILSHALPNALIPVVTVVGLRLRTVFSGVVLTETVFSWPGIGKLLYDAVMTRDYPLVQGTVLFVAVGVILVNLLVDITYGLIDPKIAYK
jgi:ABC-type dipeptide/oligopeptide/nickel transport system permease component